MSPCNCLEHFTSLISHLLCRVCLLLMLATCLGGAWVLEQPGGSALEFYPTFRWLITRLIAIDGVKSVWDLVAEGFQLHINHRHQLPHFLKKSLHLWPRFPGSIGRCLGLELKLPSLNMPMPIHHQSGCSRTLKVAVYTKRSSKVTWRWKHAGNIKTSRAKTVMWALRNSKGQRILNAFNDTSCAVCSWG